LCVKAIGIFRSYDYSREGFRAPPAWRRRIWAVGACRTASPADWPAVYPLCGRPAAWAAATCGTARALRRRPRAPARCPPKIGEERAGRRVHVRGLAGEAPRVRSPRRGVPSSPARHDPAGSVRRWRRGRPRGGTQGANGSCLWSEVVSLLSTFSRPTGADFPGKSSGLADRFSPWE